MNIEQGILDEKWIFAKTYADSNPHEYIVRRLCKSVDFFDALCEQIKKEGHPEYFFNHKYIYLTIGDYTYWNMGDVINRRRNDLYYVDDKKRIHKVDNWREILNG